MKNIENKYPWLKIYSGSIEKYIQPDYYNRLLKEYNFSKKSDIDYFNSFLKHTCCKNMENVLELGAGAGRGTDVFIDSIMKFKQLDIVDLSEDMVQQIKNKYDKNKKICIYRSDNIEYIKETKKSTIWFIVFGVFLTQFINI
ncbi:class I SAM-dependent methyltransferase [Candidatus Magnetobacterium casense]|uniref:class I SAM-dependent methyltransferase n=1 Tax=Candidatus Magnetobacterium casense TaxID=1455061 RepID=UPI00058DA7AD|nr:class I SAM-dependent methyltransferase [Candidatus Magnetobacterium casensis]